MAPSRCLRCLYLTAADSSVVAIRFCLALRKCAAYHSSRAVKGPPDTCAPTRFATSPTNWTRFEAQGLYRRLRVLDGEQKAHTSFDHRSVVNLSSNNYLG